MAVPDGAFVVLLRADRRREKRRRCGSIAGLEAARSTATSLIDGPRPSMRETPAQRDVAMVFQQYSLLSAYVGAREPRLSTAFADPKNGAAKTEIERKGLATWRTSCASRISLGSSSNKATEPRAARCSACRSDARSYADPAIYLMDEPLSSLDAKLRAELRVELKRIHADLGATLLYVTHDQTEAMTMATHVGVLDRKVALVQFGRSARDLPGSGQHLRREPPRPRRASICCRQPISIPRRARRRGKRLACVRNRSSIGDGQRADRHAGRASRRPNAPASWRLQGHEHRHAHRRLTPRSGPGDDDLEVAPKNALYFDADGARINKHRRKTTVNQFINTKETLVTEAIDGALRTAGGRLARLDGYPHIKVVTRTDWDKSKVALVSGGGSGHEPSHGGFRGPRHVDRRCLRRGVRLAIRRGRARRHPLSDRQAWLSVDREELHGRPAELRFGRRTRPRAWAQGRAWSSSTTTWRCRICRNHAASPERLVRA